MDLRSYTPPDMTRSAVLQGRYARLEPLDASRHAAVLHQAYSAAPEVWRFMGYGPFASAAAYHRFVADVATWEDTWFYAIRDQDQGKWLGQGAYLRDAQAHGSIEIGHLCFAPALQRTRAATEAIWLMIAQAFEAGYRRVEWKCDADNLASRRAAERFGFSYEGVFRQHMIVKGRNRDTAWFAITQSEFPALREAYDVWRAPSNFDANGQQQERLGALTRLVRVASDPAVRGAGLASDRLTL